MKGNLSARFGFPVWTGCGFYFLCTCLSHPFSLGPNRVSSISRKDISILRFPVWEQQVPPGCPLKWGVKASWCFITLMRTRGKDRLVFVEWSCRKINMADLLLQAGQASHLFPACPYSLPQSQKWTCFQGHLVVAARLIEVLLLDSSSKFHVCCLRQLARDDLNPSPLLVSLPPCNVRLQFFPSKRSIYFPIVHVWVGLPWSLECGRCEDEPVESKPLPRGRIARWPVVTVTLVWSPCLDCFGHQWVWLCYSREILQMQLAFQKQLSSRGILSRWSWSNNHSSTHNLV